MSFARHTDRMIRNRDQLLDLLLGPKDEKGKRWLPLSDRVIDDMVRRGQHLSSDAYPGSTGGDGSGVRSKSPLTSVEAQVNAEMFGRVVYDNVGDALKKLEVQLDIAAKAARQVDIARQYVENVGAKIHGQRGIDICAECNKPIIGMRTKRLDGEPYHNPEDQAAEADMTGVDDEGRCWWKAYNRTHGRRAS